MTERPTTPRERRVVAGDRAALETSGPVAIGPNGPSAGPERATALRLARLHLRMGSLGLARAEFEALAGSGELDESALVDLAEIRWRTGDLPGAGEAAAAALSTGDTRPTALVIAAEAAAASARPAEARRLAGQALTSDEPLDRVFAGMPRSTIWPHDASVGDGERGTPGPQAVTEPVPAVQGSRVRPSVAPHGHPVQHLPSFDRPVRPLDPERALAAAASDLESGHPDDAAPKLGLALRLDATTAERVLELVDARAEPSMSIVAGDALRLLRRDDEAEDAYRRAAEALGTPTA